MPYDHSRKIGNQGDLVKHPVLFACMKILLRDWNIERPFLYAETHAGRAEYILPDKGQWKRGIGMFARSQAVLQDRQARKERGRGQLGYLGEFDEAFLGQKMEIAMAYPGSSGIVFRLLRELGHTPSMLLCDTNQNVCDDLTRYFCAWRGVQICKNNGYTVIANLLNHNGPGVQANPSLPVALPGFVLVDPPCPDTANVVSLIRDLHRAAIPYLAWVPRLGEAEKGCHGHEAAASIGFATKAKESGATVIGVQWYKWPPRGTPGCWLAVSKGLADLVNELVATLVRVMEDRWIVESCNSPS